MGRDLVASELIPGAQDDSNKKKENDSERGAEEGNEQRADG